jgi:hypothetical protein
MILVQVVEMKVRDYILRDAKLYKITFNIIVFVGDEFLFMDVHE